MSGYELRGEQDPWRFPDTLKNFTVWSEREVLDNLCVCWYLILQRTRLHEKSSVVLVDLPNDPGRCRGSDPTPGVKIVQGPTTTMTTNP